MGRNKFSAVGMVVLLIFITMILEGCWDLREIEDLGIVVGIAIDHPGNLAGKEQEERESPKGMDREEHRLMMTQQFVVPKAIAGEGASPSTGEAAYANVSSEGDTVFQIIRQYATISSRAAFFRHLKIIVIGESVARSTNMEKLLDAFLREPEVGRNVEIMIAKGNAKALLEVKPVKEKLPALALTAVSKNNYKTSRMPPILTLGDMSKKMSSKSSFIVQRVTARGENVKVAGAAVVKAKTNTLIGWLGEEETDGINWLTGKVKGGAVEAVDEETKQTIVYEIDTVKSKIKPHVNGEEISFAVEIESEGSLAEDWTIPGNVLKEPWAQRIEEVVKGEILPTIQQALKKTQKEFKVDVVGFGKQLRTQYPKVWEKVKDNWDERFSKVPIEIKVKINIQEFGRRGMKM